MPAITSFHAENCCHLVSENEATAAHLCSSIRQFIIYSTLICTCLFNLAALLKNSTLGWSPKVNFWRRTVALPVT